MKIFYTTAFVFSLCLSGAGVAAAGDGQPEAESANSIKKSSADTRPETSESSPAGRKNRHKPITISNEYVKVQLFIPSWTVEISEEDREVSMREIRAIGMGNNSVGGLSTDTRRDLRALRQRQIMAARAAQAGETDEDDKGPGFSEEALEGNDMSRWGWIAEGVRELELTEKSARQRRTPLRDFSSSRRPRSRGGKQPANRAFEFNRQLNSVDGIDR